MKELTCTTLVLVLDVLDVLRGRDDFMDHRMLQESTGLSSACVHAACYHLRMHCAIDCVINPDGRAWWFALPPETDDCSRTLEQRALEVNKRKPRRHKTMVQFIREKTV